MNRFIFIILLSSIFFNESKSQDLLIYSNDTLHVYLSPHTFFQELDPETNFIINEGDITHRDYLDYVNVWEIRNDKLYLTEIRQDFFRSDSVANLKRIFGDKFKNGIVSADWASIDVLATVGFPKLRYGYERFHEKEIEFKFRNGKVEDVIQFDNSGIKVSRFNSPNYRELREFIYLAINWDALPELSEENIEVIVQFSADENGDVDEIEIIESDDQRFNNEVIRAVKKIPELDVAYTRGEFYRLQWGAIINFNKANKKKFYR